MWNDKILIETIIKESINKSDSLNKLGLLPLAGNYDTLNRYIKKYKIDISHFNRNHNSHNQFTKTPMVDILIENSKYTNRTKLKNKLYNEGLKERKCELCGQDEVWMNKKISLILDHINGINNDNRLENLRIICPNCNATLSTHCGKNIKDKIKKIDKKIKEYSYCEECGEILSTKGKICLICFNKKQRKVERPSYEQLMIQIKELGYCGVGRKYGVSDNSIRKWKKYYEK